MTAIDRKFLQDNAVLWQGSPSTWTIARDVYHLRGISAYLAFLVVLNAAQSWAKHIPLGSALHDSVPLAVIVAVVFTNVYVLAWLTARSTHYTVTTRRLILKYGVAISATLSIPWSRVVRIEVAPQPDGAGDIAFSLSIDDHMPYLKLWPHARPWHLRRPQPILRGVPQAETVARIATQAVTNVRPINVTASPD